MTHNVTPSFKRIKLWGSRTKFLIFKDENHSSLSPSLSVFPVNLYPSYFYFIPSQPADDYRFVFMRLIGFSG